MKIIGTEQEIKRILTILHGLECDDCVYKEECKDMPTLSCWEVIRSKVETEVVEFIK